MEIQPEWNCAHLVYKNAGNQPLINLLSTLPPGTALDCGCGAGDNARALRDAGWAVTGITLSQDEADQAARYCQEVHLADLEHGLPATTPGPFDLILFSHVLEHIGDPRPALKDAANRLSPNGHIVVALPNILFWTQRLQFLLGRFRYQDSGIMDRTHLRFYTFDSGRQMLEANGLSILSATVEGSFPSRYLRRLLPSWSAALDSLAGKLLPNLFGSQSMYVCTTKTRA